MVFCPECGEENDANANFCFFCEAPIKTIGPKKIVLKKFVFNYYLCFSCQFSVEIKDHKVIITGMDISDQKIVEEIHEFLVYEDNFMDFWRRIYQIDTFNWENHYDANENGFIVCDGYSWNLCIESNDKSIESSGNNKFPPSFRQFLDAIEELTNRKIDLVNKIKYLD